MGPNNARGSDPSWRPSLFVDGCDGIGIHFTWNRPTRRKNPIQKIIFHILNAAGALYRFCRTAYFSQPRAPERGLHLVLFAKLSSTAVSSLHHSPASI